MAYTGENPVVLFDGVCNLCNRTVDFIIKRDREKMFRFISFQDDRLKVFFPETCFSGSPDSVILLNNGNILTESDAVLQICRLLGFPWNSAALFRIVPKSFRDSVYRWIARNRYKWFGVKPRCRIPGDNEKEWFL